MFLKIDFDFDLIYLHFGPKLSVDHTVLPQFQSSPLFAS